MASNDSEVVWLDARHSLTLVELADQSGLTVTEVTELVECGVFAPVGSPGDAHRFSGDVLMLARTTARLRTDFDLPASGLTLAARLLERIRELETEVQALQARMPRYR
jgi:chaperone modulatory protein CbpM